MRSQHDVRPRVAPVALTDSAFSDVTLGEIIVVLISVALAAYFMPSIFYAVGLWRIDQ